MTCGRVLRAIEGFSRMLIRNSGEKLDEDGRRRLGMISDNVREMGQLIDDLLAFSRPVRASLSPSHLDPY